MIETPASVKFGSFRTLSQRPEIRVWPALAGVTAWYSPIPLLAANADVDVTNGRDAAIRGRPAVAAGSASFNSGILLQQPPAQRVLGFALSPAKLVLIERHAAQGDRYNAIGILNRCIFCVGQERRRAPVDIVLERKPDAPRIHQKIAVMLPKHL